MKSCGSWTKKDVSYACFFFVAAQVSELHQSCYYAKFNSNTCLQCCVHVHKRGHFWQDVRQFYSSQRVLFFVVAVIVKASSGPRYVVGCRGKVDKEKLTSGTRVALDMTTLTIMRALPREVISSWSLWQILYSQLLCLLYLSCGSKSLCVIKHTAGEPCSSRSGMPSHAFTAAALLGHTRADNRYPRALAGGPSCVQHDV